MRTVEINIELQATPEGSSFVAGTMKVSDTGHQRAATLYLATRNAEAIAELFASHDLSLARRSLRAGQPPVNILNLQFRTHSICTHLGDDELNLCQA